MPFWLTAPAAYQHSPTTIKLTAPWPADLSLTPSALLTRLIDGIYLVDYPIVITTPAAGCSVGSDDGAWVTFTSGPSSGYMVLWFHFNDFYVLQLIGTGGVDPRAIQDARAILASVTYSHNVPPPGYSPPPTP